MIIGCNSNDFNRYIKLISELKNAGLSDKWKEIKIKEGYEFDFPSTLIPRMEKLLREKK